MKQSQGEFIRELREQKGYSIEELADRAGISGKTISRLENGQSTARGYTLKKLAGALNIPIETLTKPKHETVNNIISSSDGAEMTTLKKLNLSALVVIILPLANIVLPSYFYIKNSHLQLIKEIGSKIVSFHILWFIATCMALIAAPFAFRNFGFSNVTQLGSLIFTYLFFWALNIFFIIYAGIQLNNSNQEPLKNWPNIV